MPKIKASFLTASLTLTFRVRTAPQSGVPLYDAGQRVFVVTRDAERTETAFVDDRVPAVEVSAIFVEHLCIEARKK